MARTLILGVQFMPPTTDVLISKYDVQSGKGCNTMFEYDVKSNHHQNVQEFFDKIRSLVHLSRVKAISFAFVDAVWFPNFECAYAFRIKCKEFCESNGIFYHYTTSTCGQCVFPLAFTKTMVEEGEQVAIIHIVNDGLIGGTTVVRGKDCYYWYESVTPQNPPFSHERKPHFFKDSDPNKIIMIATFPFEKTFCNQLKEIFNDKDPEIVDNKDFATNLSKATADLVLHKMGEKINPYHFESQCLNRFRVVISPGDYNGANGITYEEDLLIVTEFENHLPFEESAIVPVDPTKCIKLISRFPIGYIRKAELSNFKTKKVKVTFKIDTNCFYDFKVEPIPVSDNDMVKELSKLGITDKQILSKKARLVCDKVNLYIYVSDKNGTEYLIKNTDGSTKIPIYIGFMETEPLIGQKAKDLYHKKPDYIVFDLIQLCSLDRARDLSPFWKFKVEKEDGSLMISVKTRDGDRRSSVQSLMGLVLGHVLQAIKTQTDQEMEEFRIDFEGFEANEILKKNFVKAGKFANVNVVFG